MAYISEDLVVVEVICLGPNNNVFKCNFHTVMLHWIRHHLT